MKNTLITAVFCCFCTLLLAQEAGVNLSFGISEGKFKNENFTPEGTSNSGYQIVADVRVTAGSSYMIAGIVYHRLNIVASEEADYFSQEQSLNWVKVRTGIGIRMFEIANLIEVHSKILASADALTSYPEVASPLPHKELKTGTIGLTLGLDVFVKVFTVGFEFEKGLTEQAPENPFGKSKFDVWALKLGVFF